MDELVAAVEKAVDDADFSGIVRIDGADGPELIAARGLADRAHGVSCTPEAQFGLASMAKGFTALAVMSLVEEGVLDLTMPVRTVLGSDLPLIDDAVTVEHLLSHRSGIGDYLDEDAHDDIADYILPLPLHRYVTAEDFVETLDGFEQVSAPGEQFAYNNGGFVVLALVAERAGGVPFHDLVVQRVCDPAGLDDTRYLRSDELPGRAALGYLDASGLRTNVLHLPVRGGGDGGIFSTAADMASFWRAFFGGRIVGTETALDMVRPRSEVPSGPSRYGMGFWLHESGDSVWLTGYDAGVSAWSAHDPAVGATYTVISNWSEGAWPVAELLDAHLPA